MLLAWVAIGLAVLWLFFKVLKSPTPRDGAGGT
jgi:hypothetical protein